MTSVLELWAVALGALRANWFRAALTAFGIIVGVASLVSVSAVSAGARAGVAARIEELGANVVLVDGEFINIGTRQSATERTLTPLDVAAIAELPMVTAVAPTQDIEGLVVSAGRNQANTLLFGVTPAYADILNRTVERGRQISETDVEFGRSVMVLGLRAANALFGDEEPIGKTVRVGNHEFEVVGVLERRGVLGDENLDNRVFVPLPIVTRSLLGGTGMKSIHVQVRGASEIEAAQDEIETLLREQHHLPPGYPDDFSTEDQAEILKVAEAASTTFRILTFALGGIAMLVGGIGIMNMMLVSVHERTREIGIRKSVGADSRRIQLQFLIESVVLGTLGGLAGLLAGVVVTRFISDIAGWQTLVTLPSLALAFSFAVGVGLAFGYYPARRAARLDPIAALRYE